MAVDVKKQTVTEPPMVDRYTGVCFICGLKDAHMWRCIVWFISAGVKFYREGLVSVIGLLEKLDANRHVTDAEVKEALENLRYVKQISDAI